MLSGELSCLLTVLVLNKDTSYMANGGRSTCESYNRYVVILEHTGDTFQSVRSSCCSKNTFITAGARSAIGMAPDS